MYLSRQGLGRGARADNSVWTSHVYLAFGVTFLNLACTRTRVGFFFLHELKRIIGPPAIDTSHPTLVQDLVARSAPRALNRAIGPEARAKNLEGYLPFEEANEIRPLAQRRYEAATPAGAVEKHEVGGNLS